MAAQPIHTRTSYPPASGKLLVASVLAFFAGLLILIAFASPYWLESFPETFQAFIRMGLWEFCFVNFRYPRYQYDHAFNGCHYIYSDEYRVIREWLQPGWLMFVEAIMSVSLVFSLLSLGILSFILMRYFLKYEWYLLGGSFVLQALTAFFLFLSVAVFGARCQDRSWLMYPLYNHPSWAYGLAVIAFFVTAFTSFLLFQETKASRERKRRSHNLMAEKMPYRY